MLLLLILSSSLLEAQTLEGRLKDSESGEILPYARIYSTQNRTGTLTDENGYFKLRLSKLPDTLRVTLTGYETLFFPVSDTGRIYEIRLERSYQVTQMVTVSASAYDYLYTYLHRCAAKAPKGRYRSRDYYELKSFIDGKQIELVECYYNGLVKGYDLDDLTVKTGRIGVRPLKNILFRSTESSIAIVRMKLTNENKFFPVSPLELNSRQMRRDFILRPGGNYRNEAGDSICVIRFTPRDTSGAFFSGTVWIDPDHSEIHKIELRCEHAAQHPFLAFPGDSIRDLDLNVTKTFEKKDGTMRFQHVDFNYTIDYLQEDGMGYEVSTKALLYAYDYDEPFDDPHFDFGPVEHADYRKINALPYNGYFWEQNTELSLHDEHHENEAFLDDPHTLTNRDTVRQHDDHIQYFLLKHAYLQWSPQRMLYREAVPPDVKVSRFNMSGARNYNLLVHIFADRTVIGDSVQIVTAVVFDPYGSYFHLPSDREGLCFINMYFDLAEILRREFERRIAESDRSAEALDKLCYEYNQKLYFLEERFCRETAHGVLELKMKKWNQFIRKHLAIDNLEIFKVYASN